MSKDVLLKRIGDLLHIAGRERERAANILLQWIVARLRFDQSIRIKGIGIFQLKKEPLPRVDRKNSPGNNPINKRTLYYAPQPDEGLTKKDSAFVSFDLDELNINSSDYLDKVFNLNVDKPLIPVQENSSERSESEAFGDNMEPEVEEKIEELVKNSELLENYSILENYALQDDFDKTSEEHEDDYLLTDEMLQSIGEDSGIDDQLSDEIETHSDEDFIDLLEDIKIDDDFGAESDSREDRSDENMDSDQNNEDEINILDPSILNSEPEEEEEIVLKYDEIDEEDEEEDESELLDPAAFIEESESEEEDTDITPEKIKDKKEIINPSSIMDDYDLKEEAAPLKQDDSEKLDIDEQSLKDDLNVFVQKNSDEHSDREDQDIQEINNLNDEKFNLEEDELLNVDLDKDIQDLGDIGIQAINKEQIIEDKLSDSDVANEIVEGLQSSEPGFTPEDFVTSPKEDDLLKELEIPDVIEEKKDIKNKGNEEDTFAQLEDYLNNDSIGEAETENSADSDLRELDNLDSEEIISEQATFKSQNRSQKKSSKKLVITFIVLSVIAAGLVSTLYFDILGEDFLKDLSSLFSSESTDESGTEVIQTPPPAQIVNQAKDVKQGQGDQVKETGLYRDIPNDRQITNQIYFDGSRYTVQVSSWKSRAIAEKEAKLLRASNFDAFIFKVYLESKKGTWHRVRIGYFNSRQEAEDFLRKNKF